MTAQPLGQRIADQRKKLGLSQETLGEKMGASRQTISKWESDGTIPEIDKLIALSRPFSSTIAPRRSLIYCEEGCKLLIFAL